METKRRPLDDGSSPHSEFSWYKEGIWIEVAKWLDGNDLISLAVTNKWFYSLIMDDMIWKYACDRDLEVPLHQVSFKWSEIYAAAFGTHAFCFHQKEKHIDWMRLGAFVFESSSAVLTDQLAVPDNLGRLELEKDNQKSLYLSGSCILKDIRMGVWIADLHRVRCLDNDNKACKETMQILDVRHVELFLEKSFRDGSWQFEFIGYDKIPHQSKTISGAIVDYEHINSPCTAAFFNNDFWFDETVKWHARTNLSTHVVAFKADRLHPRDGRDVIFHAMRSKGSDEKVVSIRIIHRQYGREFTG